MKKRKFRISAGFLTGNSVTGVAWTCLERLALPNHKARSLKETYFYNNGRSECIFVTIRLPVKQIHMPSPCGDYLKIKASYCPKQIRHKAVGKPGTSTYFDNVLKGQHLYSDNLNKIIGNCEAQEDAGALYRHEVDNRLDTANNITDMTNNTANPSTAAVEFFRCAQHKRNTKGRINLQIKDTNIFENQHFYKDNLNKIIGNCGAQEDAGALYRHEVDNRLDPTNNITDTGNNTTDMTNNTANTEHHDTPNNITDTGNNTEHLDTATNITDMAHATTAAVEFFRSAQHIKTYYKINPQIKDTNIFENQHFYKDNLNKIIGNCEAQEDAGALYRHEVDNRLDTANNITDTANNITDMTNNTANPSTAAVEFFRCAQHKRNTKGRINLQIKDTNIFENQHFYKDNLNKIASNDKAQEDAGALYRHEVDNRLDTPNNTTDTANNITEAGNNTTNMTNNITNTEHHDTPNNITDTGNNTTDMTNNTANTEHHDTPNNITDTGNNTEHLDTANNITDMTNNTANPSTAAVEFFRCAQHKRNTKGRINLQIKDTNIFENQHFYKDNLNKIQYIATQKRAIETTINELTDGYLARSRLAGKILTTTINPKLMPLRSQR